MRSFPVLFVLAFALAGVQPVGATSQAAANVTIVHAYGAGVLLTWEPVPDADHYAIFRVDASGHATLIAETRSSVYFDFGAADVGRLDYNVEVVGAEWGLPRAGTPNRGECIHTSSSGAASVTVKDCREATIGGER